MKKIYILKKIEPVYLDKMMLGIYSTKEKAMQAIEEYKQFLSEIRVNYYNYEIQECDLDSNFWLTKVVIDDII